MVFARFEQKNVDKLHTQEQPLPPTKLSQKLLEKNLSLLPEVAIGSKQGERTL